MIASMRSSSTGVYPLTGSFARSGVSRSGNGTFGQALHGEIIEFAAFDDLHAWRDAVVGKSRAIAGSVLVTCLGSSADIPAMTPCADTSTLALARQPWIEPITGQ
jgi:hypothetical protein